MQYSTLCGPLYDIKLFINCMLPLKIYRIQVPIPYLFLLLNRRNQINSWPFLFFNINPVMFLCFCLYFTFHFLKNNIAVCFKTRMTNFMKV